MSWFTSLLSFPKPADAPTPLPQQNRLLEEPPSKPEPEPSFQPLSQAQPTNDLRPNRNRVIFGAGIAFFAFSMLITRRSFARRKLANPAFYTNAPGHHAEQAAKVSAPLEAFEALSIATVNVLSLTMMASSGALWYLDINSMADARKMLRGGLGVDGTGRSEQDAEEEFEEWMAVVLARKDAKASKDPRDR